DRVGTILIGSCVRTLYTANQPLIHGWILHLTWIISGVFQLLTTGAAPGGCDWFHGILPVRGLGSGWILWAVGSLVSTLNSWPTSMASTWGVYIHPFWSNMGTWVGFALSSLALRPSEI